MADIYSSIGMLAGVIEFIGFLPYILDTLNRRITPNKATWIIWAVLGIIIAASYYASGARDTAWMPIASAIGILIVALLSLKYGEEGWTLLDKTCLIGAGTGLALWWYTSDPELAYGITTIVDAIGALPTIKKAYDRPESERNIAWLLFFVACTLNLLAIRQWTPIVAFYPVYVFFLNSTMSTLVFLRRTGSNK
jgi:Na+/H+ antiporter NhaC